MSEAELAGEAVAAPPPKSKAIPLVLAVNTLLVAGVLVFTLTKKAPPPAGAPAAGPAEKGERPAAGPTAPADKSSMGPTVRLDNFVVQLKAVEAEKYAHLVIEVEVPVEEDKAVIAKQMPRIRDAVVSFLADRTADELRGSEGIAKLKQEVFERLQKVVPGQRVLQVFVTDFIVQ
jgi:flagellar FliL protein